MDEEEHQENEQKGNTERLEFWRAGEESCCWQVRHDSTNEACGEIIFIKNSSGTRNYISRVLVEDMVWITAEHAVVKSFRVGTLEIGDRVDGKTRGLGSGGRLITFHGLIMWVHEQSGWIRNIFSERNSNRSNRYNRRWNWRRINRNMSNECSR